MDPANLESDNGETSFAPPPPPPPPPPPIARSGVAWPRRRTATAAIAGGMIVGGLTGGYMISQAASETPSPAATPSLGTGSAPTTFPPGPPRGVFGGAQDRGSDAHIVASALGISTTQLHTELSNGSTIASVAKNHNVDLTKVISALVDDQTKEIDSAMSAGRITQAQATDLKSHLQQMVTDMVNGVRPPRRGPRGAGMRPEDQAVIAGAIGITTAHLQTELGAGKTIAAIATAQKVDPSTVISALVASENKEIDAAVSAGSVTQAEADNMKSHTQQRVTDQVNGTRPAAPREPGSPPGFGAPAGGALPSSSDASGGSSTS